MIQDWREYLKFSREALIERLIEVVQEQAGLAQEISMMQATERRAKAQGWSESQETTVTGRERSASLNALEITATVIDSQGRKEALALEADLLKLLLDVWNPDAVFGT